MTVIIHSDKWKVDYTFWDGQKVPVVDAEILTALEAEVVSWWGHIKVVQGGLSTSVAASANTHAGLGAFDVSVKKDGKYRPLGLVLEMAAHGLRSGQIWFIRGYGIGRNLATDPFRNNKHVHIVSRESFQSLHPDAQDQLREYQAWVNDARDGDGLVGTHPYPGPNPPRLEHWSTSPYNPANVKPDLGTYYVDVAPGAYLKALNVDREVTRQRERGYQVDAVKRVHRWGRANIVTSSERYYALEFLSTTKPS